MRVIALICFLVWLYVLWTCHRGRLKFFEFIIGSVGLFVFMMIWVQPIITAPLTKLVAMVAGELGEITGMYDSYYQYSMLFIPKSTAAVSLYVDLECSGVIETMAFLSLLWFFRVYNVYEKIVVSILGILGIFAANVIRIFCICTMIYIWGNDIFYFAHSIFGRMVFYAFSISLYFYVFTKAHIVRQRVGNFSYGDGDEEEGKVQSDNKQNEHKEQNKQGGRL